MMRVLIFLTSSLLLVSESFAQQGMRILDGTNSTSQADVTNGRLNVDGSGVTQPVSAASLPLPTGAATAANQDGIIKDGTGDTTQANVTNGRLHVDGSGVTQPVSGSVTVTQGTGTNLHVVCDSGCSSSTSPSYGSAFPSVGTPIGFTDGTNLQPGRVVDADTGAGTVTVQGVNLLKRASGGPVEAGTATDPLRIDPTGTTTQPVSGTITANQGGTWNINSVTTLPALPSNQSVNVSQINGVTPLMGNGVTGTGSQRVTIASDNTAFTVNAAQSGTWTVQPGNTQNTTAWLTQPQGGVAHGATDSGNPIKIGCQARTTNRTAVTDGQRADVVCDQNGELLVTPIAPRARVGRSGVVTVSTTTETTLVAAGGAGVFRDLTYLKCTNGSATLTRMDLRDATAGTVIDTWWLAANGGGFNLPFSVAYPQASANNNWTIQLSTAVTDVRCAAEYVEKN